MSHLNIPEAMLGGTPQESILDMNSGGNFNEDHYKLETVNITPEEIVRLLEETNVNTSINPAMSAAAVLPEMQSDSPVGEEPPQEKLCLPPYNFKVNLGTPDDEDRKNCMFSASSDKYFIKWKKNINIEFECAAEVTENLFVRAVLVFQSADDKKTTVKRCYFHLYPQKPDDMTNIGNEYRMEHMIWFEDSKSYYCKDKRYSVVVPLVMNGTGKMKKIARFMCRNSCYGTKCNMAVIFTLENERNQVLGRHTLNMRVCSSPGRDMDIIEKPKKNIAEGRKNLKRKFPNSFENNSVEDSNKFLMIKVPKTIAKTAVRYCKFSIQEIIREERRNPTAEEKVALVCYEDILRTLDS